MSPSFPEENIYEDENETSSPNRTIAYKTPNSFIILQERNTPQFSPIHIREPYKSLTHTRAFGLSTEHREGTNSNSFVLPPLSPMESSSISIQLEESMEVRSHVDEEEKQEHEFTQEEERRLREEAESEALARQLMAEEAMASYHESSNFLLQNQDQYSEEDLALLRAIMQEENPVVHENDLLDDDENEDEDISEELSYDALLRLGERIGDVKTDRWKMRSKREIEKLPQLMYCSEMGHGKCENDSDVKCLVCQFQYEIGDIVRKLPCKHYFHKECVDPWLGGKDHCPYCRQCIILDD